MNFVNPALSILFFAIVYLLIVYGLLAIAQINKPGNNPISRSSKKISS